MCSVISCGLVDGKPEAGAEDAVQAMSTTPASRLAILRNLDRTPLDSCVQDLVLEVVDCVHIFNFSIHVFTQYIRKLLPMYIISHTHTLPPRQIYNLLLNNALSNPGSPS
jgi:hypothetical protein